MPPHKGTNCAGRLKIRRLKAAAILARLSKFQYTRDFSRIFLNATGPLRWNEPCLIERNHFCGNESFDVETNTKSNSCPDVTRTKCRCGILLNVLSGMYKDSKTDIIWMRQRWLCAAIGKCSPLFLPKVQAQFLT